MSKEETIKRQIIFRVTIYNNDRTTIYVTAENKFRAVNVYEQYVKEHYIKDFIDEYQDFEIETFDYTYILA